MGNQIAKVFLSFSPAREQTAEANTNLSHSYRFACAEVPKPQKLCINFPLSGGLCKHRRKQRNKAAQNTIGPSQHLTVEYNKIYPVQDEGEKEISGKAALLPVNTLLPTLSLEKLVL